MTRQLKVYFSLVSPWAYIGHGALQRLKEKHGLQIACASRPQPGLSRNPAACRCPNAIPRGNAIASLNCSAGATSAA